MATDRIAKILKSSGEFSDDEIARMTEDEAWRWIHSTSPSSRATDIEYGEKTNSPESRLANKVFFD